MTKNTPSCAKKHRESTEPESHQTATAHAKTKLLF